MTDLGQILAASTARLREAGVEGARRDARLLIGHLLGIGQAEMVARPERALSAAEAAAVEAAILRRVAREPVSRILGSREFYGLEFGLGAETLDPRPDSETLVEAALAALGGRRAPRVLDLGTGTGCLLLAVLAERTDASGVGVDIAEGAVTVAAANADALGMAGRATFLRRDWTAPGWRDGLGRFDLVLANPPYIPDAEIASLEPEVRNYEPRRALAGGRDGLDPYRLLVPQLADLLVPDGIAGFEFGLGQEAAVAAMFAEAGLAVSGMPKDLGGVIRCVIGVASVP